MLWRRRSVTFAIPDTPAPVPDGNATRRAALQASWRRGRFVARRRLAWRWTLWFVLRGLLPALLLAVTVALAWLWLFPQVIELVQPVARPTQHPIRAIVEPGSDLRIDTELQLPSGAVSAPVPDNAAPQSTAPLAPTATSTTPETLRPNGLPTPLKP